MKLFFHTSLFLVEYTKYLFQNIQVSNYEHEILIILKEVGPSGMPLRRIALNVYNIKNSLFYPLDKHEVYDDVADYLRTQSTIKDSPIEKASQRGWYKLNYESTQLRQLLLDFQIDEADEWMM